MPKNRMFLANWHKEVPLIWKHRLSCLSCLISQGTRSLMSKLFGFSLKLLAKYHKRTFDLDDFANLCELNRAKIKKENL